jgi:NADH-quinone oxidoreductase chain G
MYVNGEGIEVPLNTTVLKACESAGFEIPRFCYHKKLSIAGNCRMCLVEIENSPKPVVSCSMPVVKNMNVFTDTPLVKKARENVIEFLLMNHPLDCPVCDQGGECDLQDQAMIYGSDRSRFQELKRGVEDKNIGPLIKTIMTRCIHCTRCVRFGIDIAGIEDLGTTNRGGITEIGTYVEKVLKTELSGNIIDLCPVGALTSKPYAFSARPWELKSDSIIDITDAFCNSVRVDHKNNKIIRISPDYSNLEDSYESSSLNNQHFQENWISDKTRFSYDGLSHFLSSYETKQSVKVLKSSKGIKLKDLSSFKNFFFEELKNVNLNSTKSIKFVCGYSTDLESLTAINSIVNDLNENGLKCCSFAMSKEFYTQNMENVLLEKNKINFPVSKLKHCDTCLFIGVNPRFESSLYNIYISKRYKEGGLVVASIGEALKLNYSVLHLGLSLTSLHDITTKKHPFSKRLHSSKNVLILVGARMLESLEFILIHNFLKKINLTSLKYSVLSTQPNYTGALSMKVPGIDLGSLNEQLVYLVNTDPSETKQVYKSMSTQNQFLQSISIHQNNGITMYQNSFANKVDKIDHAQELTIPVRSYLENPISSYTNLEGTLIQNKGLIFTKSKNFSVLSNLKNLQLAWSVLKKNSIKTFNFNKLFNNTKTLKVLKNSYKKNSEDFLPLLKLKNFTSNYSGEGNLTNFSLNFNFKVENSEHFKKIWYCSVQDFYLTDSMTQSSSLMGQCSLLFRKNFLNFK